jgi:hypothetical protein
VRERRLARNKVRPEVERTARDKIIGNYPKRPISYCLVVGLFNCGFQPLCDVYQENSAARPGRLLLGRVPWSILYGYEKVVIFAVVPGLVAHVG